MRWKRWWKWLESPRYTGRRYLIRLATTKPVSRNGTARMTRGTTSAIRALVFSEPSTTTAPSSRPSRFEPESPMKTEAGWKLWTRKPSAAPAMQPASTPAASSRRSNAMTEKPIAEIAQTPAASASTPSEKLTTFMTATSPISVSGPPSSPRSTWPRNGKVKLSTRTPARTQIRAAAACPSSLTPGERSLRSSTMPTTVMSAAAPRMPRTSALEGRKSAPAASTPARMARPPSSGVRSCARPRSWRRSTAPMRVASRPTNGVMAAVSARASRNASSARASMGRQGSQGAPSPPRSARSSLVVLLRPGVQLDGGDHLLRVRRVEAPRLGMGGRQIARSPEQQLGEVEGERPVHLRADHDVVRDRHRRHGRRHAGVCAGRDPGVDVDPAVARAQRPRERAEVEQRDRAGPGQVRDGARRQPARPEEGVDRAVLERLRRLGDPEPPAPDVAARAHVRDGERALGDDLRARVGRADADAPAAEVGERADGRAPERDDLDVAAVDLGQRAQRHRPLERLPALDGVERRVGEREGDVRAAVAQPQQVLDRARRLLGRAAVARHVSRDRLRERRPVDEVDAAAAARRDRQPLGRALARGLRAAAPTAARRQGGQDRRGAQPAHDALRPPSASRAARRAGGGRRSRSPARRGRRGPTRSRAGAPGR